MASEFQQAFASAAISAVLHPVQYAKVLIQIGHEPINPAPCKTLFGRHALSYPNVLKYLGHIKKQDGFLGLYRGVGASVCSNLVGTFANRVMTELVFPDGQDNKQPVKINLDEGDIKEQLKEFCMQTGKDCLVRCTGIVASHPMRVIMIRSMAQFVGGETQYNSFFSSVVEIYREDGILGFFAGLVPRLIGELLGIWIASLLAQGAVAIYGKSSENKTFMTYTHGVCSLLVSQFTYPFHLVSTIQATNTRGLAAGSPPAIPSFAGWTDCWAYLRARNEMKRGSSMFFRYYTGPVILVGGRPVPAAKAF